MPSGPNARVAQLGREVMELGHPNARVAQLGRETMVAFNPIVQVAQLGREVMVLGYGPSGSTQPQICINT
jgi:hypothetical protein